VEVVVEEEKQEELKPCPFCGGSASLEHTRIGFGVVCWNCQIKTLMDWTKEKAISIWNTRAGA
jgi:Lar family restriction alleviation protein